MWVICEMLSYNRSYQIIQMVAFQLYKVQSGQKLPERVNKALSTFREKGRVGEGTWWTRWVVVT